jgi:FAD/FMN-containing dehydrogenase
MTTATDTLDITGLDGDQVSVPLAAFEGLAERLDGRVLLPGDDGWDEAVRIWNAMVATTPAVVAQPASTADVAVAVAFARDHGLLTSIKGGGHNIAGTSMAPGGLTLDMSHLRDVTVDHAARLAHVGAGCLLQDVDAATQVHGLATVLGFVSDTGVAGLTLGGGFGYLARRFGWAADNLEAVEIVTADGTVHVADRERDADLFWAIRGGGGNFGVVTRFTFRLHEVGPMITGGLVVWSAEEAERVLGAYRELTESAPRELTAATVIRLAPPTPFVPEEWHGKPIIGVLVCHSGSDAEADLAAIRGVGSPIVDLVAERPYTEQQQLMDGSQPHGLNYYWKTEFLPGLTTSFLDAFREHALRLTSPLSESVLFHLSGALNDRDDDDGAVGNRDAHFVTGFAADWPPDAPGDDHIAWAREGWERIRPFSTGGNYVNFQLAEDDHTRTADAYRRSYERLQQVKATYDPDNLFRVNRNITPAR